MGKFAKRGRISSQTDIVEPWRFQFFIELPSCYLDRKAQNKFLNSAIGYAYIIFCRLLLKMLRQF